MSRLASSNERASVSIKRFSSLRWFAVAVFILCRGGGRCRTTNYPVLQLLNCNSRYCSISQSAGEV